MDSPTVTEKEAPRAKLDEKVETEKKKPEKDIKEELEELDEEVEDEETEKAQKIEPEIVHTAFTQGEVEEFSEPEPQFANEEYIKSFENRTIDDFLREEKQKSEPEKEEEKKEKDTRSLKEYFDDLRREKQKENEAKTSETQPEKSPEVEMQESSQSSQAQEISQTENLTIEKPNYDLIELDKKIVKLTQKKKKSKKKPKKAASIALAIALGISGVICITNCVLIDQQYSAYVEIGDTYELNLSKYLKNISNLDATKKSMEVIETYPEEVNDAGDLGESSNWFDRICNFLSGLFGG